MDQDQNQPNQPSEVLSVPEMQHRHRRAITMAVILFVLLVVAMFAFTFMKQSELEQGVTDADQTEPLDNPYSTITRIDGKHFYIDGVHTVVGEIAMPTPCDLLESTARIAESFPEQITLDFSVINNADTCVQVITPQRFKVSAEASAEATFSALFQNRVVELNLTPAAPGETPDDFELFIKG